VGPERTPIPGSEQFLARGRPGSLDSVQRVSDLAAERGGRHPREKAKNCPCTAKDRFSHGWGWDPFLLEEEDLADVDQRGGKIDLQHMATAAAINVTRISDWLAGRPREGTRTSPFARLMATAVAA